MSRLVLTIALVLTILSVSAPLAAASLPDGDTWPICVETTLTPPPPSVTEGPCTSPSPISITH